MQIIDQRIAHLRSIIPQCKATSSAAEKRLADTIIILEIKRIEAIHVLEKRLTELRASITVYKARCPTYEHVLAKQINNFDVRLIAAKKNNFYLGHPEHIYLHHIYLHHIYLQQIYPHCSQYNQAIWPEFFLNALNRFKIFNGNPAIQLALQSVTSDWPNTYYFPMPRPTSIRRFLKPGSIVDETSTYS